MLEPFANSGNPDQTPCSAASELDLHCSLTTRLEVSRLQQVNNQNKILMLNLKKAGTGLFLCLFFFFFFLYFFFFFFFFENVSDE